MSDVINNEAVLDATEKALDVIEDQLDGVVEVVEVVRNNPVLLAGAAVVGLLAGGAGGYFFARKRLGKTFDERLEEEVEQAKEFYRGTNKVDDDGQRQLPEDIFKGLHGAQALEALKVYRGEGTDDEDDALAQRAQERASEPVEVVQTVTEKRVFERRSEPVDDEDWNLEAEVALRDPALPYVVHHDEFYQNVDDRQVATYTYYEGDQTLANENDFEIANADGMVGVDNLLKFGHGSKDANVVYVCNEGLDMMFEIVKSPGKYAHEVMAFQHDEPGELRHSNSRRPRGRWADGD